MRRWTGLLLAILLFSACDRATDGAKEALNKGGELAGKAAGEVIEGVASVNEAAANTVTLPG